MSTKEQIEEAKKHVKSMVLLNIIPAEAKDPPHEDRAGQDWMLECDAVTLLDALEAAEQELAEYKRKAVKYSEDSCSGCTATMALRERAEAAQKERDKWKTLAEETEIERERIAAQAGEAEARIMELEAAGEKMRSSCILREACDEWGELTEVSNVPQS